MSGGRTDERSIKSTDPMLLSLTDLPSWQRFMSFYETFSSIPRISSITTSSASSYSVIGLGVMLILSDLSQHDGFNHHGDCLRLRKCAQEWPVPGEWREGHNNDDKFHVSWSGSCQRTSLLALLPFVVPWKCISSTSRGVPNAHARDVGSSLQFREEQRGTILFSFLTAYNLSRMSSLGKWNCYIVLDIGAHRDE